MSVVVAYRASDAALSNPLPFVRIVDVNFGGLLRELFQVICEDGEERAYQPFQLLQHRPDSDEPEVFLGECEHLNLTEAQRSKAELLTAILPPVQVIREMRRASRIAAKETDWLEMLKAFQSELARVPSPQIERACPLRVVKQPICFDFKIDFACASSVVCSNNALALCVLMTTQKFIIPSEPLNLVLKTKKDVAECFSKGSDFWSETVPAWAQPYRWNC
jgi:hypothetical protein